MPEVRTRERWCLIQGQRAFSGRARPRKHRSPDLQSITKVSSRILFLKAAIALKSYTVCGNTHLEISSDSWVPLAGFWGKVVSQSKAKWVGSFWNKIHRVGWCEHWVRWDYKQCELYKQVGDLSEVCNWWPEVVERALGWECDLTLRPECPWLPL